MKTTRLTKKVETADSVIDPTRRVAARRAAGPFLLSASTALFCLMAIPSCGGKKEEVSKEQQMKNIDAEIEGERKKREAAESTESE